LGPLELLEGHRGLALLLCLVLVPVRHQGRGLCLLQSRLRIRD
jgi:hypothetical protein